MDPVPRDPHSQGSPLPERTEASRFCPLLGSRVKGAPEPPCITGHLLPNALEGCGPWFAVSFLLGAPPFTVSPGILMLLCPPAFLPYFSAEHFSVRENSGADFYSSHSSRAGLLCPGGVCGSAFAQLVMASLPHLIFSTFLPCQK